MRLGGEPVCIPEIIVHVPRQVMQLRSLHLHHARGREVLS
jgi:hypothetical protein